MYLSTYNKYKPHFFLGLWFSGYSLFICYSSSNDGILIYFVGFVSKFNGYINEAGLLVSGASYAIALLFLLSNGSGLNIRWP